MEIDITKILISLVTLMAALAEIYVIPWIKSKLDTEKLNELIELAKLGVQAAEQIMGDGKGAEKKQFVIDYLKSKGLKFDAEMINAAIEAAVLEMNNALLK